MAVEWIMKRTVGHRYFPQNEHTGGGSRGAYTWGSSQRPPARLGHEGPKVKLVAVPLLAKGRQRTPFPLLGQEKEDKYQAQEISWQVSIPLLFVQSNVAVPVLVQGEWHFCI